MQQLLVQLGTMFSGSRFLSELLSMHPDIGGPITGYQVFTSVFDNDFKIKLHNSRTLDISMNDDILSAVKSCFLERDRESKFLLLRLYIHETWSLPLLLYDDFEYKMLITMRDPASIMRSIHYRNEPYWPIIAQILSVIHVAGIHRDAKVLPIDQLALLPPDNRVSEFSTSFEQLTGLSPTEEMKECVASWEPFGVSAKRNLTPNEILNIVHRLRVSKVYDYLSNIGINYQHDYLLPEIWDKNMHESDTFMFIAAHCDDFELGAGCIAQSLNALGKNIYTVIVASGAIDVVRDGVADSVVRRQEACNANVALGLDEPIFLEHNIRRIDCDKLKADLKKLIHDISPDVIFTHYYLDHHIDHSIIGSILHEIYQMEEIVSSLYFWNSTSSYPFESSFEYIGKQIENDKKWSALKEHKSQKFAELGSRPDYPEKFLKVTRYGNEQ